MFQDMTKKISESMEPLHELFSVQSRVYEEVARQQIECARTCMEAAVKQVEDMQKCRKPVDLIEAQQAYTRELEKALRAANEHNLKALKQARAEVEQIARSAMSSVIQQK